MTDQSALDSKYFIDRWVYNCPFCNRRNVAYTMVFARSFDWTDNKKAFVYFVKCNSCNRESMHLSYADIHGTYTDPLSRRVSLLFEDTKDIDSNIFYSVPTSFFVLDERIPRIIRELITEAEGCLKMNFLTGASACTRKAIYELTILEHADGEDYESKIKSLKAKHPDSDPELFNILAAIQNMTSDKIHEQSWAEWDSQNLRLIIETIKTVLNDIYVNPKIRTERSKYIQQLREKVSSGKTKGADHSGT